MIKHSSRSHQINITIIRVIALILVVFGLWAIYARHVGGNLSEILLSPIYRVFPNADILIIPALIISYYYMWYWFVKYYKKRNDRLGLLLTNIRFLFITFLLVVISVVALMMLITGLLSLLVY